MEIASLGRENKLRKKLFQAVVTSADEVIESERNISFRLSDSRRKTEHVHTK